MQVTQTTASHNPVIRRLGAEAAVADSRPMTVAGTIQKTALLLGLVVVLAGATWWAIGTARFPVELQSPVMLGSILAGFGLGILVAFRPATASWAGPLYAVCQGLALGLISYLFNARYAGLPVQAVGLTAGTAAAMLIAYRTRLVRVGERFKAIVVGLTGGVAVFYLIALGLRLIGGISIPFLTQGGLLGIGFSVFVVALAAVNLLLDFSSIEEGAQAGISRTYEWAFATGVTITMVWLYLEILRLLSKLRRN
ncbi:MAG: Bax inhibitor-1/YccA family protein [Gemmatimonadota bacterium]